MDYPEPDYGSNEYANFHEVYCRADIGDLCVETDVALSEPTIRKLIEATIPHHEKYPDMVAVRINRSLSSFERTPIVEVVSASFYWLHNGEPVEWEPHADLISWGAVEQVSRFRMAESDWTYLDTFEVIYDPV